MDGHWPYPARYLDSPPILITSTERDDFPTIMTPPAKPKNETLRQAAVERMQLLGVPLEDSFERLTRLATGLLSSPKALLSLADGERQLLRAQIGRASCRERV